MKLVIVESPNKVSKIQTYLGKDYKVIASVGHINNLKNSGMYNIGIDSNFNPQYELSTDKVDVLKNIFTEVKKCDEIYIATDPDREGEAIAYHIESYVKDFEKPTKRLIFHEITKPAIKKALANCRDIDYQMVNSQQTRQVLDKIVGFMCSPYLSSLYGQKSLSAGRVQSVAVKMISEREEEIKTFKPETYFTLQANLEYNKQKFVARYNSKIEKQKDADVLKKHFEESPIIVSSVIRKEEKKNPQPPLITSTLQQYSSKTLKISADKSMSIAQKLFEQGIITYIRTDSPAISEDALPTLLSYLDENGLSKPSKPFKYAAKGNAQEAHECIRPVDINFDGTNSDYSTLTGDELKVYKLIRDYYIASQMNPAIYNTLKVTFDCNNKELIASGKSIKDEGYLVIFGGADKTAIDIPDLKDGDIPSLTKEGIVVEKKQTKPPARYNQADLIKTLEVNGIGRPSTFASILKKISERDYVELKNEIYYPTELGIKISKELNDKFKFMDISFSKEMEEKLDLVAEGKTTYLDTIKTFYNSLDKELSGAYIKCGRETCPKCNTGILVKRNGRNGDFFGCNQYPNCRFIKNIDKDI